MPSKASPLDELPFSLARSALDFRRFNELTLQAAEIPSLAPGYASVLHALKGMKDCTVRSLVEKTHLPNGTLTGLLDGLEREGHLQRLRNPADGRSWLIRLTPSGKALCKQLERRHGKVVKLLAEGLTEDEAAQLVRLLDKVGERMRGYKSKG